MRDFALIRCSLATIDLNCNRTPYKRIILFLQAALLIAMANTIRAVDAYADVGAVAVCYCCHRDDGNEGEMAVKRLLG